MKENFKCEGCAYACELKAEERHIKGLKTEATRCPIAVEGEPYVKWERVYTTPVI